MKIPKFIKQIKFIFMPKWWHMNHPYSKEWDAILNTLLEKHTFYEINDYMAKLGNETIWITNHPYASFNRGIGDSGIYFYDVRPSRLTLQKAMKALNSSKILTSAKY